MAVNDKELTTKTPLTAFIIIIKITSHSLFFFIHYISLTYDLTMVVKLNNVYIHCTVRSVFFLRRH